MGTAARDGHCFRPRAECFSTSLPAPMRRCQRLRTNLGLTERAVWGVVRDLRHNGMILLRKKGRRHYYAINLDAPLLHPTIRGMTLRPVLGKVASKAKRERPEDCD